MEALNHVNWLTIVLMLLGVITYLLLSYQAYRQKYKKEKETFFDIKFWFRDNILTIIISIVFGFSSVLMGKDLFNALGIEINSDTDSINYFHAYVSGLLGQAILQKLRHFFPKSK